MYIKVYSLPSDIPALVINYRRSSNQYELKTKVLEKIKAIKSLGNTRTIKLILEPINNSYLLSSITNYLSTRGVKNIAIPHENKYVFLKQEDDIKPPEMCDWFCTSFFEGALQSTQAFKAKHKALDYRLGLQMVRPEWSNFIDFV